MFFRPLIWLFVFLGFASILNNIFCNNDDEDEDWPTDEEAKKNRGSAEAQLTPVQPVVPFASSIAFEPGEPGPIDLAPLVGARRSRLETALDPFSSGKPEPNFSDHEQSSGFGRIALIAAIVLLLIGIMTRTIPV